LGIALGLFPQSFFVHRHADSEQRLSNAIEQQPEKQESTRKLQQ
jgi:hypothetical protein